MRWNGVMLGILFLVMGISSIARGGSKDPGNPEVRYYALIVGVADYQDDSIPDLNYTDDDAYDIEYVLWSEFPNWYNTFITLYIDAFATKLAIQSELTYLANITDDNDVVVF